MHKVSSRPSPASRRNTLHRPFLPVGPSRYMGRHLPLGVHHDFGLHFRRLQPTFAGPGPLQVLCQHASGCLGRELLIGVGGRLQLLHAGLTAVASHGLALLTEPDSAFWLVSCPLSIHFGWIVAAASLTPSILLRSGQPDPAHLHGGRRLHPCGPSEHPGDLGL